MAGAKLIALANTALAFENKLALIYLHLVFNEAKCCPGMPVCQGTFVETKHPQNYITKYKRYEITKVKDFVVL